MSSPFGRLERIASRSIDRVNDVSAILRPMERQPNGRGRADPTRPPAQVRGVLDLRQRPANLQIGNREARGGNDLRTVREAPSIEFSLDIRQIGALSAPRQGDGIEIKNERYEITSSRPDGHSRVVLALVKA